MGAGHNNFLGHFFCVVLYFTFSFRSFHLREFSNCSLDLCTDSGFLSCLAEPRCDVVCADARAGPQRDASPLQIFEDNEEFNFPKIFRAMVTPIFSPSYGGSWGVVKLWW